MAASNEAFLGSASSGSSDSACEDYAQIASYTVSCKGTILTGGLLSIQRTVKDVDNDTTKIYQHYYNAVVQSDGTNGLEPAPIPATELPKSAFILNSKRSGICVRANNTDVAGSPGKSKAIFEIFRGQSLTKRIDASSSHSKIIGDGWFGGASFSDNEEYFAYVAGNASCYLFIYRIIFMALQYIMVNSYSSISLIHLNQILRLLISPKENRSNYIFRYACCWIKPAQVNKI